MTAAVASTSAFSISVSNERMSFFMALLICDHFPAQLFQPSSSVLTDYYLTWIWKHANRSSPLLGCFIFRLKGEICGSLA
jgi:hypothetical protein